MTEENIAITNQMLSGVYFGLCKFLSNKSGNPKINLNNSYKYVLSIGWNPYYENEVKTIEVFIIDYIGDAFYEEVLEIDVNYFLRTEANFENFGELVTAITYDIIQANIMLSK
jgi:FAD synthase